MTKLAIALAFIGLNFYIYNYMAKEAVIPPRATFDSFPLQLGEWSCLERESASAEIWKELGATDLFICNYSRRDPDAVIGVYFGYHATQIREEGGGSGENSIHPPAHCLPGSGWDIIKNESVLLDLPEVPRGATIKRLVIAKGKARQLVYYWYQGRGRVTSEDWQKVLFVGVDRALLGRTDGALVRFTIPVYRGDEERAEQDFLELAPKILERLSLHVPV